MIQAADYPKFRVKMLGMSVGVWAMSDVQVGMTILVLNMKARFFNSSS